MRIAFQYHTYPSHTVPYGALPDEKGAQACWFFYTRAQAMKEKVGDSTEDQILLEGELWMDKRYVELARSVALVYGLDSPDEFAKFWQYVQQEAYVCGLPTPAQEYMRLAPGIVIN
jgi:hypothetical protein